MSIIPLAHKTQKMVPLCGSKMTWIEKLLTRNDSVSRSNAKYTYIGKTESLNISLSKLKQQTYA